MDVSSAPATTDGAIEVASQFSCMRRQDLPNKKAGARGVYTYVNSGWIDLVQAG